MAMQQEKMSYRIELENLWLGYEADNYLLKAVNTGVRAGEMIALVGLNGTGKSTLLKTISGIRQPQKGAIRFNGKLLGELTMREFAASISFVGTGNYISEDLTVFEMVSLGRHPYTNWWGTIREHDREKILESLNFVGMEDFSGVKVSRLSDGERQRVMIAMSLAQDTRVMILDEPTAFLDIPNRIGIIEVLHKLRKNGRTIIYSTHEFDHAFTHADKIWMIHDRALVSGAPEDLGIDGAFDRLFSDAGVTFDSDNLRFIRSNPADKVIGVNFIDERVNYWTCRALERAGYRMETEGEESLPFIRIEKTESGYQWTYRDEHTSMTFKSLYTLTEHLDRIR